MSENSAKEFHKLMKSIGKVSDGQAKVYEWDDEDVSKFKLEIAPKAGPYCGGKFIFQIELGDEFPECPPDVIRCETKIYHPNIDHQDESGEKNICLNLFDEDWTEISNPDIENVLQGLLFLFYDPNIDDPLSPLFSPTPSRDEFLKNVLLSLKGETVMNEEFPWNYELPSENANHETAELHYTSNGTESKNEETAAEAGYCPVRRSGSHSSMDVVTLTEEVKISKAEKPQFQRNATGVTVFGIRNSVPNCSDSMAGKMFGGSRSMSFNLSHPVMARMNSAFALLKSKSLPIPMETS